MALSKEATFLNYNFSQQVLDKDSTVQLGQSNPFAEAGEKVASVGYHYRRLKMDDYEVIVRAEVDGFQKKGDCTCPHCPACSCAYSL